MTRSAIIWLGLVFVSPCIGYAQAPPAPAPAPAAAVTRHPEEGRPFIRIYQPIEIGGGSQTWCVLQDRRGVLYVGTNSAVLEFDGAADRT